MKKTIAILLCLMFVLSVVACQDDVAKDNSASADSSVTSSAVDTTTSDEMFSASSSSDIVSSEPPPTSSNFSKPNFSTISRPSSFSSSTANSNNSSSTYDEEKITIPNQDELVFGEDYGGFYYDGDFVSYDTFGDLFYMVFSAPNTIVSYNTATLELVSAEPLPGKPAELQVDETTISISYPLLQKIVVYNRDNFEVIKEYELVCKVGSFCIDGDLIYYAGYNQHTWAYRTNTASDETVKILIPDDNNDTYYEPKMFLDKANERLYIGEARVSTCELFCYSTNDFSLIAKYSINAYSMMRTMFLIDNELYWNGLKFNPSTLKLIFEYGASGRRYMYYVDQNFVFLNNKIYDRKTGKLVAKTANTYCFAGSTQNRSLVIADEDTNEHYVIIMPYYTIQEN